LKYIPDVSVPGRFFDESAVKTWRDQVPGVEAYFILDGGIEDVE